MQALESSTKIISLYPLTAELKNELEERLTITGDQIVLSNITAKGYWAIFLLLRKLDVDDLYFPIFNSRHKSLIPLFKVLGAVSAVRKAYLVMPDYSLVPIGPGAGIAGCLYISFGILVSSLMQVTNYFRVLKLLKASRIKISRKLPKRILFIKQTLWLGLQAGGSIAHARGVIKGLLGEGRKVDLLSFESPLPLPETSELRILEPAKSIPYLVPRKWNFSRFNKEAIEATLSVPFERYGAIYQRLSTGSFSGVILSRFKKIPLIIEYNGSEAWLSKNWGDGLAVSRFIEWAENVCLKHAHLVVTVSDVLKDQLIERGIDPHRIVSYPNCVDPNEFDSEKFSNLEISKLRDQIGVPDDAVLLTFVGSFGDWHGADFLAKVLTGDSARWFEERNIYFCFVGDGVRRKIVEQTVENSSLNHRFKITGLVSQETVPLYLAASDILVSPHLPNPDDSPFFGSPTKLFEYMAAARPVIASDLFQIGDVLKGAPHVSDLPHCGSLPTEDQCGVLVRPKSGTDIIQAIQFLFDNPEWRRVAGRNARKMVMAKYTWARHTEEIGRGLVKAIALDEPSERKLVKVLLNALHAKTGGGVTYLKNILPLISKSPDFEFHLCIHEEQTNILPELDGRVHLHTLDFRLGYWRLPLSEQIQVPMLARKIGADVTFSPANYGPLFAPNPVILLRNALGVAFVERRPAKIMYWLLVSIGTALSMLTCRRAIAVSKYARASNFGGVTGFLRGRFSIIPHGVSDMFSPNEGTVGREEFVLAVSDIYVQKNFINLLNAIASLKADKPNIKLKIAGRFVDENYHRDLNAVISEKGLQENVEFLGGVEADVLADLYRRCAVFVFPSTVETFGNPLIEAMASGAPVASSNTAAMPEVAGDGALYFDPHDIGDMASCIDRLLTDRKLCADLSQKALVQAKKYSWEKTAECTLDVLYQAGCDA